MSLKSKLKIESVGMFASFVFYAVVGIIWIAVLPITGFPPHVGIIAILSLVTAYGLFKSRIWVLWLIVVLFFVVTTFSAYTLYYASGKALLLDVAMIAYLILTWIFTAYIASERKMLES